MPDTLSNAFLCLETVIERLKDFFILFTTQKECNINLPDQIAMGLFVEEIECVIWTICRSDIYLTH